MISNPATVLMRLAALFLVVGSWYPARGLAADAPAAPPAVTVSQPIQRELVEWDEFTGQFAAKEYVEIRARVSGYLTEIHFEDGQIVKQGDLLFVIDPRPYEATLAAARAQLAQGNAQVELATRQLERTAELRKKDFEPASNYDQRVSDLKVATAATESAKAAIRSAELNVGFTRITSPLTGRISNHQVSVGNLVSGSDSATTPALTTIVSLDPIYFYFNMSEGDYLTYQRATAAGKLDEARDTSAPVYVRLTDEPEWPRKGLLNFIDNQVDRGAGTIRARATFANADFFVTPGQFGRIRIPASERHDAILIPDSALVTDQSRKVVMTVKDDGTVEQKVVRPGPMTDDGLRIIRSGLAPADRVIINGLVRARPGGKVTPQPGKIETAARP
jgi:RND family efflux transporter MFP subunit